MSVQALFALAALVLGVLVLLGMVPATTGLSAAVICLSLGVLLPARRGLLRM